MKIYWKLIKWSIKTVLMLTGILSFFRCSSGYKEKDGKITFNGKEITDKKFVVLNDVFAKDDSTAYYKRYSVNGADVHTFVGVDKHYAKDKSNVFYCDEEREGQNYYLTKHSVIFKVNDAEPASFHIMGEGYEGYAKDNKRAYFKGRGFEVKDVASLTLMEGQFVKDKYQVYFDQKPVKRADVQSFGTINNNYAKDNSRAYYYGYHSDVHNGIHEILCDVASFSLLEYPYSKDKNSVFYLYTKIAGADPSTFSIVGSDFSKDQNHVYLESKILKNADPATFEIITANENSLDEMDHSKDKNHVFWKGNRITELNVGSFKVLGLGYATDGKIIFFHKNLVKNADASTFKTFEHSYGDSDAEDANNKYLEGKKVEEE